MVGARYEMYRWRVPSCSTLSFSGISYRLKGEDSLKRKVATALPRIQN